MTKLMLKSTWNKNAVLNSNAKQTEFYYSCFKDIIFEKTQKSRDSRDRDLWLIVWFGVDLAGRFGWTYKCFQATRSFPTFKYPWILSFNNIVHVADFCLVLSRKSQNLHLLNAIVIFIDLKWKITRLLVQPTLRIKCGLPRIKCGHCFGFDRTNLVLVFTDWISFNTFLNVPE